MKELLLLWIKGWVYNPIKKSLFYLLSVVQLQDLHHDTTIVCCFTTCLVQIRIKNKLQVN